MSGELFVFPSVLPPLGGSARSHVVAQAQDNSQFRLTSLWLATICLSLLAVWLGISAFRLSHFSSLCTTLHSYTTTQHTIHMIHLDISPSPYLPTILLISCSSLGAHVGFDHTVHAPLHAPSLSSCSSAQLLVCCQSARGCVTCPKRVPD
jgi:hypothetical protein